MDLASCDLFHCYSKQRCTNMLDARLTSICAVSSFYLCRAAGQTMISSSIFSPNSRATGRCPKESASSSLYKNPFARRLCTNLLPSVVARFSRCANPKTRCHLFPSASIRSFQVFDSQSQTTQATRLSLTTYHHLRSKLPSSSYTSSPTNNPKAHSAGET